MGRQTVLPGHGLEIHQLVQPDCGCVVCFYQQHHAPGLIAVQRFGQQLSPVAFSAIFRQDINIVWLILFKAMGHIQISDNAALVYGQKCSEFLRCGGDFFAGPIHVFSMNNTVFHEI